MLASSSSPQLNASTSKYSASHKSPYSFRAPSRTTTTPSSPRTSASAAVRKSGSASPSTSKARAPPPGFRSPKRPTAEAATQYSPTGSPPTAHRFQAYTKPLTEKKRPTFEEKDPTIADSKDVPAALAAQDAPPEPPDEPQVRETPRSTLAATSAENSRPVSPAAPGNGKPTPKRRRRSGVEVKILPANYAVCEAKVLAALIAGLLMDLVSHNDKIKLEEPHLTRFHSRTSPGISVHDYMQRLTFHATLPTPVLLAMVNYIDKLCEAFPIFTVNSLTVHRFLIAAATVAAKGLCDVFWTNSTYAKVGGVSKKELAVLEMELLTKIEWRIIPDPEQLGEYYKNLVDGNLEFEIEGSDSPVSSSSASSDSIGTDTMSTD